MLTEVWFRNIRASIREVMEVRHPYLMFERGTLVKFRIDPVAFADLYVPKDLDYRMLIVGNHEQGAAEIKRGYSLDKPAAVFPVWSAEHEDIAVLEELLVNPLGEDVEACEDEAFPVSERPVLGQEHRIVITDLPSVATGPGRKLVRILHEMQEENPQAIIHLSGTYSWKSMFGTSIRSVDFDARTQAAKGTVYLPNGKQVSPEKAVEFPQWVKLLNFKPVDLKVPRNRCLYNIKSALWAARHYGENVNFKSTGRQPVDTEAADSAVMLPVVASHKRSAYGEGDKFVCNSCTISKECKLYREGAVCSVPQSEPASLARYFNTRDSGLIIEGLGALLGKQADRLEKGLEDEEFGDELDPEVSKLINSLFANGVKLAKLTNPELSGGPKVGVFVNGGHGAQVAVGTSANQLTASIVRELEAKGVPREEITPEMIGEVLESNKPAIEAQATRHDG
jgi:hypothetical protein